MKSTNAILFCILICLCFSCSKPETGQSIQSAIETIDNDDGDGAPGTGTETLAINELLLPYYERFIEEMLSRGEDLRDIPIGIYLVSPNSESEAYGYCGLGYANYENTGNARVIIVYTSRCWTSLSDIEKENLMFHEFGHALTARPHLSETSRFPNGSPRSLMCSSNCSGFNIYGTYQDAQRSFYLDELLDEDINMPDWANSKTSISTLEQDDISGSTNGWVPKTILPSNSTINPYSYSIDNSEYLSPSYSLAITATTNSQSDTYGNWYKDFIITNFDNCSNLTAEISFKSYDALQNGFLNLIIDLYDDVDSETEFARHYAEPGSTDVGSGFYRIRTRATCIPDETVKFRIRLYVKSESNATVYFDDLKIKLFE